jgi:hypothetical protein
MSKKEVKLKNRYTGEIVYTKDMNDVTFSDGIVFVKVFNDKQPNRIYLANREAFEKVT